MNSFVKLRNTDRIYMFIVYDIQIHNECNMMKIKNLSYSIVNKFILL